MASNNPLAEELNIQSLRISSPTHDASTNRPGRPVLSGADEAVKAYLLRESKSFASAHELRERGWDSPEGDKFYQQKRERIMNTSRADEARFYAMYQQIADAMQTQCGAFTIENPDQDELRALNLCLAPGGYTKKLLEMYPTMTICGITLPESEGGHEVLIKNTRLDVEYLDMNLLPFEYGLTPFSLPDKHPDSERFLLKTPFSGLDFDIVVADGAVLRTHTREEYRQDKDREALRLRIAQLIFGISRIKPGGTFIILLHRIDSWENMVLLRNFEQFATVTVFKHSKIYNQSTSFYLIAKDVQPQHTVAVQVLEKWKQVWQTMTFGGEKGTGAAAPEEPSDKFVAMALKEYGPRLVELGAPVWDIQAQGLSKASYINPRHGYGAAEERRFPRYTGGVTWFSEMAEGEGEGTAAAVTQNRPPRASAASWRA